MKSFFIIMAFLGGIFSSFQIESYELENKNSLKNGSTTSESYEIKQIYVPRLSCKIDGDIIERSRLDEYARQCFDVAPQHIKMMLPAI